MAPEEDGGAVVLDARTLRGIAHPLRVRLLGLLRREGPSTATRLAGRVGLSAAAVSYHLRQLALYGFVVDDDGPADRHARERWWRAAHRSTWLERTPSDPAGREAALQYLRAVWHLYVERTEAWLEGHADAPQPWRAVGTLSDTVLSLTAEQARELDERITALVAAYPRLDPDRPGAPEARPVAVQWQVLPEAGPA